METPNVAIEELWAAAYPLLLKLVQQQLPQVQALYGEEVVQVQVVQLRQMMQAAFMAGASIPVVR